ncbi:YneF family protein [Mollicutes bacterium LVI A0039]|nr:YneF family protein [Mollicutes bacterium LVI A0039]
MTIATGWFVLIIVVTFILGIVAGTFLSRFTLRKHFEENPPISEDMIANMLKSMGQPASQKRVNQIVKSMKANGKTKK